MCAQPAAGVAGRTRAWTAAFVVVGRVADVEAPTNPSGPLYATAAMPSMGASRWECSPQLAASGSVATATSPKLKEQAANPVLKNLPGNGRVALKELSRHSSKAVPTCSTVPGFTCC